MKKLFYYLLFTAYHLLLATYSWSQVGFGVSVEPGAWERQKKDKDKKPPPDGYAVEIASRFSKKPEDVAKLFSEGFGRKETIKILVMSGKANISHLEIVKMRNKKKTFTEISKKYELDYPTIKNEAEEVFRNVRYGVAKSTAIDAQTIKKTKEEKDE